MAEVEQLVIEDLGRQVETPEGVVMHGESLVRRLQPENVLAQPSREQLSLGGSALVKGPER